MTACSFFAAARAALIEPDPARKCALTSRLAEAVVSGRLRPGRGEPPPAPVTEVGRPARPLLVAPDAVPNRRISGAEGHAALLHAIAHIEFNAINLALDCAYRFRELPEPFYSGWVNVAAEEAHHFSLLRTRLLALGRDYGDFPAHDGLWAMAVKTAHDPLPRMALVPRVLEARGLDATPPIMRKLSAVGDADTLAILEIILRDEIDHVALGDRWFRYFCAQRGLEAEATYLSLIDELDAPWPRPPLNLEARREAGFGEHELQVLSRPRPSRGRI